MKRSLLALVLVWAATALHADDDYIAVSECGTVIGQPGHYRLVNDLLDCSALHPEYGFYYALGINSDKVSLDLAGHTIGCAQGGYGIVTGPFSKLQVYGGTITWCDSAIELFGVQKSTVRDMTLTMNFAGIGTSGGSDNRIIANHFSENVYGILMHPGLDVSKDFMIHRNLAVDNWMVGIYAEGMEDSTVSCNRLDRNGFVGLAMFKPGLGNMVRNNVANDNYFIGIGLYGWDGGDLPEGNVVKGNTAMGNATVDLLEGLFAFPPLENPVDECLNVWRKNQYETQIAVEGCIAPSRFFGHEGNTGCAPGYGDD